MKNPFKKEPQKKIDNSNSFANRRHVQEFNKAVAKKAEAAKKKKNQ
jgi:hypothetical protein